MPTYSYHARESPRRKEGVSPTPAPVWLPNLTTRCPLRFDCPPGETSRFPRGKLANMSKVTQILAALERGDPHAAEQLLPLVYDELRKFAAAAESLAGLAAGSMRMARDSSKLDTMHCLQDNGFGVGTRSTAPFCSRRGRIRRHGPRHLCASYHDVWAAWYNPCIRILEVHDSVRNWAGWRRSESARRRWWASP